MKALAGLLLLLLAAGLEAQQIDVTTSGIISITSALPPIYNGKYVLQTTDFGFLWLDADSLGAGLVQAEAKCNVGQPPSSSGIYVIGDCNGTGTVSTSGGLALVRQFNSQCGAATKGCDGPSVRGPARLTFELGTWKYRPDLTTEIPDSTQSSDPNGKTWSVAPTDGTGRHFRWTIVGSTTPGWTPAPSPPTPEPSATPTPRATPTPGGLICGPIPGVGLCYYCATGDPAPCPGVSPSSTPTLSPTPGLPTSTPTPTTAPQVSPTPTPTRGRPPAGMSIGSIFLTMRYTAGGVSHEATAVNLTGEAGYFWFFSPNNIEVAVKVLDARAINGHYWIFWAAMTDLEWTLTVRSSTGTIRTYSAPAGRQTSGLDTESF